MPRENYLKVTISTFGSRGDVEPPLALAVGLQARGHEATLVAPRAYAAWIRSYGVRWAELRFDFAAFMHSGELLEPLRRGKQQAYLRALGTGVRRGSREALDDFMDAAAGSEFIVQSACGHGGVEIADRFELPMAFLYPYPYAPTRAFPSFFLPQRISLGGLYNRWTQAIVLRVMWRTYGPPLNQWRAERLGLPPWRSYAQMLNSRESLATPNLIACSPTVLAKPADWSANHHVTGFLALPPSPAWTPPPELLNFLDRGPPPVYVGFGSMREGDPERQTRAVLRALERCGRRGILLVGGGGALARVPAPDHVLYLDNVPHRWLFPRVAAAVHHGGPGTLAAALHAGLPSVIFPHVIDQHGWAEQAAKLGVGINVAVLKDLRVEPLAAAIGKVIEDRALRERAAALGRIVRAEDGVGNAVELIERHAAGFRSRRRC